jgi:transcriptional regulator with XRE-family HTH domain
MNFEQISSEWLRFMRGRRSQRGFSKRLGYSSNIAYRWETGICYPLAREAFALAKRGGVAGRAALLTFHGGALPNELAALDLGTRAGVAELLRHARGKTSLVELARRSGHSRFSIARWLRGSAEPRLPELLSLLEAATFRVLDFLACFTSIEKLPSVAQEFRALEAARKTAYDVPWSHAVLRALELSAYQKLRRHRPGWLAQRLNISRQEEERCLKALATARQIKFDGGRWVIDQTQTVDTRAQPERGRRLKAEWLKVALERLEAGVAGVFGYNLMSMSRADLARLREMHIDYFRRMQALVTDSAPSECVVLFNADLFALDDALPSSR